MVRKKFLLINFLVILFTGIGLSANTGKSIQTLEDLINYAVKNHPDIKILRAERKQNSSLKINAEQTPNPEFDSRLLYGSNEKSISGEYTLKHTFELGGKKDNRLALAKEKDNLYDKKIVIRKQELVCELIISLYYARQLHREIDSFKESITTFGRIIKKYRRLPFLNPEQTVSINVIEMARDEVHTQMKILQSELQMLQHKMKLFIGDEQIKKLIVLIPPLSKWPIMKPVTVIKKSPYLALAQSELKLGKASYDLARADAWPNISIGPSINTYNSQESNETEAGFALSVTLPLYHQDQGKKEYLKKGIAVHKEKVRSLEKKLIALRNGYVEQYSILRDSVRKLSVRMTSGSKHRKLHRLLRRGVVPAVLVVEHHRQENELLKTYDESIMKAITALWNIYAIDGRIFKGARNEKK